MAVGQKQFTVAFDEKSLASLEQLTHDGGFKTMDDALSESLRLSHTIHSEARDGFTQVVLRNPKTNEERVVVVPSLQTKWS